MKPYRRNPSTILTVLLWPLLKLTWSKGADGFLVQKTLGQGAFGTVYLAHDEELDRQVAIKVPRRDRFHGERDLSSFLDEARTVAKLRHPGIVSVFDVGRTDDGLPFVALAYIEGESLAYALKSHPPSPERAAQLMAAIAEAVAEAHRQGFVHRDLKPANSQERFPTCPPSRSAAKSTACPPARRPSAARGVAMVSSALPKRF